MAALNIHPDLALDVVKIFVLKGNVNLPTNQAKDIFVKVSK